MSKTDCNGYQQKTARKELNRYEHSLVSGGYKNQSKSLFVCLFDLILYVPSTIFQL